MTQPLPMLENTSTLFEQLSGRSLALFLDYDGTLTPIVTRPEQATLPRDVRGLLEELTNHCTLAIVSGRDQADVANMVKLPCLTYAGSRGFDISGPDDFRHEHDAAQKALPSLDRAEEQLKQHLATVTGAIVERKRFAIAVHYREVADDHVGTLKKTFQEVAAQHSDLRQSQGKKIHELHPDVEWDKGRAVQFLLEVLGCDEQGAFPVYVGDDTTDEDAFKALKSVGLGVRVTDDPSIATAATYYLRNTDEVHQFLIALTNYFE